MNWRALYFIQGLATLSTFIVIVIDPNLIPESLGLTINKANYAFPLLIGANELALSYLSFSGRTIKDYSTIKKISTFFVVFHLITCIMCVVAYLYGGQSKILGNAGFRLLMTVFFYYYGIFKINKQENGK